ncbi:MAG: hypothetical protein A3E82_04550 [Gammaproteobacteria bacterium RIFCSPHIGHO2_12_FULL_38_11]|nr:MAG: hypothetical protein A3E82_04550 [Gammaproteobacteria bacterium RIFCSPHIGHO2_12_FULL_38_11]
MRFFAKKETDTLDQQVWQILDREWNSVLSIPFMNQPLDNCILLFKEILKQLPLEAPEYQTVRNSFQQIITLKEALGTNSATYAKNLMKLSDGSLQADFFENALKKIGVPKIVEREFDAGLDQLYTIFDALVDATQKIMNLEESHSKEKIKQHLVGALAMGLCVATRLYHTVDSAIGKAAAEIILKKYENKFTRLDLAKLITE